MTQSRMLDENKRGRHQSHKIKPFYDYCNGRSDDALEIKLIQTYNEG